MRERQKKEGSLPEYDAKNNTYPSKILLPMSKKNPDGTSLLTFVCFFEHVYFSTNQYRKQ
ncbi:MAG: hypothetical protein DYG98_22865 [Haliscomenobacteraceae bacterium CHB4]|nr:hypothetical protein [Haliscomenobacteraceae bacterium CHB4]